MIHGLTPFQLGVSRNLIEKKNAQLDVICYSLFEGDKKWFSDFSNHHRYWTEQQLFLALKAGFSRLGFFTFCHAHLWLSMFLIVN